MSVPKYTLFIFLFIALLSVFACSHKSVKKSDFKRRELSEYYVASGTVDYFLPVAPNWINFSQSASCLRKTSIKHLDISKVRDSFSLSYEQAIQFQYMINQRFQDTFARLKTDYILLKDEEQIFHDVSDKIQANFKAFRPPKYKRVNLVWIDSAVNSALELEKLKKLMKNSAMDSGHPVFVSLCLNFGELKAFMQKHGFADSNIRMIPFEMFTVFDKDNKQNPGFMLYFLDIFRNDQELHFFISNGGKLPPEFQGSFAIHNF